VATRHLFWNLNFHTSYQDHDSHRITTNVIAPQNRALLLQDHLSGYPGVATLGFKPKSDRAHIFFPSTVCFAFPKHFLTTRRLFLSYAPCRTRPGRPRAHFNLGIFVLYTPCFLLLFFLFSLSSHFLLLFFLSSFSIRLVCIFQFCLLCFLLSLSSSNPLLYRLLPALLHLFRSPGYALLSPSILLFKSPYPPVSIFQSPMLFQCLSIVHALPVMSFMLSYLQVSYSSSPSLQLLHQLHSSSLPASTPPFVPILHSNPPAPISSPSIFYVLQVFVQPMLPSSYPAIQVKSPVLLIFQFSSAASNLSPILQVSMLLHQPSFIRFSKFAAPIAQLQPIRLQLTSSPTAPPAGSTHLRQSSNHPPPLLTSHTTTLQNHSHSTTRGIGGPWVKENFLEIGDRIHTNDTFNSDQS